MILPVVRCQLSVVFLCNGQLTTDDVLANYANTNSNGNAD